MDWEAIFAFDTPLLEIFLRGTLTYLALFGILRFVLKRQSGVVGIGDLLVIVVIADASSSAFADDYRSVPSGILLVAVIVFWSYAIDWLGYHSPFLQKLFFPPPLPLVRDGKMLRKNMRRELITESELMSQLRQQGVEKLEEVRLACMEGDGQISVVAYEEPGTTGTRERAI